MFFTVNDRVVVIFGQGVYLEIVHTDKSGEADEKGHVNQQVEHMEP